MSDTGNGEKVRISHLEDRQNLADTYRHEIRNQVAEIKGWQELQGYKMEELSEDLKEGLKKVTTRLDAIDATTAKAVEEKSNRRFQVFLAFLAPLIGGAIGVLLLGGHP